MSGFFINITRAIGWDSSVECLVYEPIFFAGTLPLSFVSQYAARHVPVLGVAKSSVARKIFVRMFSLLMRAIVWD